jgi:hypothetical protein
MDATPPIIVDWKGLKKLGWPYSRVQTWRLMEPEIHRVSGSKFKGTDKHKEWVEPNPNPFPQCVKLFDHRGGRVVWRYAEIVAYLKKRGLYTEPTVVFEIS